MIFKFFKKKAKEDFRTPNASRNPIDSYASALLEPINNIPIKEVKEERDLLNSKQKLPQDN